MATFPCAQKGLCIDPSTPFQNFTAEAPDKEIFIGINTGFGPQLPPLGSLFLAAGCTSVCESKVSQADADLCAANANIDCLSGVWPTSSPGVDVFGNPVPVPHNRFVFKNSPQSATVSCPDGNPFVYTVPAGKYSAFSQALANATALSDAQQNAPTFLVCIGNLAQTQICAGVPYNDSVTATGNFLTDANACWDIIGSLPPGVSSTLSFSEECFTGSRTLSFFGTPTIPGVYTFGIQVEDGRGDFMVKTVTIRVVGILGVNPMPNGNTGSAYLQPLNSVGVTNPIFSLDGGALPDGLNLDPTGQIFGTPTTGGTFNFVLGVTEAGTGLSCESPASITIGGTCVQPVLKYATDYFSPANTVTAYRTGAGHYTAVFRPDLVGGGAAIALNDVDGSILMSGVGAPPGNALPVAVYDPPNDKFYEYSFVGQTVSWDAATLTQIDAQGKPAFGQNFTWDVIYNPVNSLVYLNANTDLVVFNPAIDYATPVADIGTGTVNVFFAGKLSLDTATKRLFSAFGDLSLAVWTGSVVVYDTTGPTPVLLHRWFIPAIGAGGVLLNSAIFAPGTNKIYVIGSEQDAGHGDQRDFVIVMDATTGAILANLNAPDNIGGIGTFGTIANPTLNPVANLLYIPGSASIMVLCTNTDTFLTSLALAPSNFNGVYVSFNNTVSYLRDPGMPNSMFIENFGPP